MSSKEISRMMNRIAQIVGENASEGPPTGFGEQHLKHYRAKPEPGNLPGPPYGKTLIQVPYPLKLSWVAMSSIQTSGYGRIGQMLGWALQENGVELIDPRYFGWDFRVIPTTPRAWMVPQDGSVAEDLVIHAAFDGDLLPDSWVRILNRAGAVWAPSQWCKDNFERSGVVRPMFVSGYGIMPDVFNWVDRDFDSGPFTFLAWGGRVFDRKNVMMTIKTFGKLNLPDSRLVVKLSTGRIKNIKSDRDIRVCYGELPDWELAMFLYRPHCLVYPSCAEGFGLMPLEAMATGLPVILTDYSGMQEYMTDETCIPLRVKKIVDAELTNKMFGSEALWAQPDEDDLADKMIWAYENRDTIKEIGRKASEYVIKNWTWREVGIKAKAELLALRDS